MGTPQHSAAERLEAAALNLGLIGARLIRRGAERVARSGAAGELMTVAAGFDVDRLTLDPPSQEA